MRKSGMHLKTDSRIVLTLDAGGTNFRFSAICGGERITETVAMPPWQSNPKWGHSAIK